MKAIVLPYNTIETFYVIISEKICAKAGEININIVDTTYIKEDAVKGYNDPIIFYWFYHIRSKKCL